jgi:hypothetical protein
VFIGRFANLLVAFLNRQLRLRGVFLVPSFAYCRVGSKHLLVKEMGLLRFCCFSILINDSEARFQELQLQVDL